MSDYKTFEEYICSEEAELKSDVNHLGKLLTADENLGNDIAFMYRENTKTLKTMLDVLTLDLQRRIVNDATPYQIIPLRNKLEAIDSLRALFIAIEQENTRRLMAKKIEATEEKRAKTDPKAQLEAHIGGDNASSM